MILLPENPTLEVITSEDIADAIVGETAKISKRNGIAIVESSTKPREKGTLRRWLRKKNTKKQQTH